MVRMPYGSVAIYARTPPVPLQQINDFFFVCVQIEMETGGGKSKRKQEPKNVYMHCTYMY